MGKTYYNKQETSDYPEVSCLLYACDFLKITMVMCFYSKNIILNLPPILVMLKTECKKHLYDNQGVMNPQSGSSL